MTADRTQIKITPVRSAPVPPGSAPPDAADAGIASGGILAQAQAFSQVAREAYNACQHGQNAVEELRRRRNRSGQ